MTVEQKIIKNKMIASLSTLASFLPPILSSREAIVLFFG